jgi:hypothetical protein
MTVRASAGVVWWGSSERAVQSVGIGTHHSDLPQKHTLLGHDAVCHRCILSWSLPRVLCNKITRLEF